MIVRIGFSQMVELDKENADRLSKAGTSFGRAFKERDLELFVQQIFFGPIQLNPSSTVNFKWSDNPDVSGMLKFQVLHEGFRTDMKISFEMFEGCFGFVSTDSNRHALILKFREPCQKKTFSKFATSKMKETIHQYSLTESSPAFLYITIFLNESATNECHNAIAEDDNKKLIPANELKRYMISNMESKFRHDGNERYWKIRKRTNSVDLCFYDSISTSEFGSFLNKVGIRMIKKHGVKYATYEGTKPKGEADLHNSSASNSLENVARDALHEFVPGKIVKHHSEQIRRDFHSNGDYEQVNAPLAHLTIDQKHMGHGVLGKRPRSKMEHIPPTNYPPPTISMRRGDGEEEDEDEEDFDEEMDEEDEDEEEDEEDEEMDEYSQSPKKKSSTPEIVDLDSDEDETAPSPTKKPKPRDILMTYKSTTLHFEDMKGLFFDEMVNDTIVDLYLSMMRDEQIKEPMRDKTHVFSCFFYKRLTDGMTNLQNYRDGDKYCEMRYGSVHRNYAAISKWTRKVDLFAMDYVVVPVVDDLHWYLIVIVKPWKCIVPAEEMEASVLISRRRGYKAKEENDTYAVVLDSLYDAGDQKRQTSIDIIRDYLEMEYNAKKGSTPDGKVFDRTRLAVLRPKGLPQQSNFLDCGFFLMKYAETFLSEPPNETKLKHGVFWKDWYIGFEISVRYMRELVARTIEKKTDKKVWKEYKQFERSRRDEWDPARRQKEALHIARRRRYPSEEPRPNGEKRVRRHSEPPSLNVPMACHFH